MRLNSPASRLVKLPAGLGEPVNLEKLDLIWNKSLAVPGRIRRLEEDGCAVFV